MNISDVTDAFGGRTRQRTPMNHSSNHQQNRRAIRRPLFTALALVMSAASLVGSVALPSAEAAAVGAKDFKFATKGISIGIIAGASVEFDVPIIRGKKFKEVLSFGVDNPFSFVGVKVRVPSPKLMHVRLNATADATTQKGTLVLTAVAANRKHTFEISLDVKGASPSPSSSSTTLAAVPSTLATAPSTVPPTAPVAPTTPPTPTTTPAPTTGGTPATTQSPTTLGAPPLPVTYTIATKYPRVEIGAFASAEATAPLLLTSSAPFTGMPTFSVTGLPNTISLQPVTTFVETTPTVRTYRIIFVANAITAQGDYPLRIKAFNGSSDQYADIQLHVSTARATNFNIKFRNPSTAAGSVEYIDITNQPDPSSWYVESYEGVPKGVTIRQAAGFLVDTTNVSLPVDFDSSVQPQDITILVNYVYLRTGSGGQFKVKIRVN
jgi:hypothetical protein